MVDPRDGNVYRTVVMPDGNTWMAENLDWAGNGGVYYDYAPSPPFAKAGRLYTWQQAISASPPGWHLPSDDEWENLIHFSGGKYIAGENFRATSSVWRKSKNKNGTYSNGYGTDAYGFSALPSGYYSPSCGFKFKDCDGRWWSVPKYSAQPKIIFAVSAA